MSIGTNLSIKEHDGVLELDGGLFLCQPGTDYEVLTRQHIVGSDVVVYSALVSRYKYTEKDGHKKVIHCPSIDHGAPKAFTNGDCVNPGGDSLENGFQAYIFATRENLGRLVRAPFPTKAACVAAMTAAGGNSNTCFWVFAPSVRGEGNPGEALRVRADAFAFALRANIRA
jgi:hypothetical protein